METKAIFVRHAEAKEQHRIAKGAKDEPLDEHGRSEARKIGQKVGKLHPKLVITSPLQRAKLPAQEIAKKAHAPLKVLKSLVPWKFGDWTGKPKAPVEKKLHNLAMHHPNEPTPGKGGESFNRFMSRASEAVKPIKQAINAGKKPAVVWHSRQDREKQNLLLGAARRDPTKGGSAPGQFTLLKGHRFVHA